MKNKQYKENSQSEAKEVKEGDGRLLIDSTEAIKQVHIDRELWLQQKIKKSKRKGK